VEINLDINNGDIKENLENYLKLLHEENWEGINGEETKQQSDK
jgi:hypothetical protein